MSKDPRIAALQKEYDLRDGDLWELPQKRGSYCIKHAALEIVAAKAGVVFDPPQVLEANGANGVAAICVRGTMGNRSQWSIGEASPKNNKNAYPFAMAEKRAIDRVILKLVGLHGLLYSEEESDDFEEPTTRTARVGRGAVQVLGADETTESERKTVDLLKAAIDMAKTADDLAEWKRKPDNVRLFGTLPAALRQAVADHAAMKMADLADQPVLMAG